MKLNRILSLILSVILVLGTISAFSFAEETEEIVYGVDAFGITNALGISEYTEENLSETITRGEFFKLACALAGFEGTVNSEILYKDLALEHEAEPYIKTLTKIGVVGGTPDGNILADENISLAEAAAVILKLAGYGTIAETKGGFPSGYYSTAKLLKMFRGLDIGAGEGLTKGMAALLIRNSLEVTLIGPKNFTADGEYSLEASGTFLYSVFKAYHIEDVVNGVDISRLIGENDIIPYFVSVGEVEAECRGVDDIYSYLGYRADLYYIEEKGELPKAIYIQKSSDNKEITVDIGDIEEIKDNKLRYWHNEEIEKTVSFINGIPVIYNGVSTKSALSEEIFEVTYKNGKETYKRDAHGYLRLIDNSKDGIYDVAVVNAYDNFVVSHVDTTDKYIYDRYDSEKKLLVDTNANDPYTIVFDAEGEESDIREISKNTIVSVYHSASDAYQQYVRIYVPGNTVSGKIEKVRKNGEYITIGGTEYRVNEECQVVEAQKLKLGSFVKLFLDVEGKVAYAEYATESDYIYGFIIEAGYEGDEGSINKPLKFNLYKPDNTFEIIEAAEKILLDGAKLFSNDSKILTRLNAASVIMNGAETPVDNYSTIIRYRVNTEGKISSIDTLIDSNTGVKALRGDSLNFDDRLFMTSSSGSEKYYRTYYTAGPQVAMQQDTPVIIHPSPIPSYNDDMSDENLYMCGTAYNVLDSGEYIKLNAFYTNTESMTADIVSFPRGFNGTTTSRFATIKSICTAWDEKLEEEVVCLEIYGQTGDKAINVKPGTTYSIINEAGETIKLSADNLKVGDLIKYTVNIDNQAVALTLYYSPETDTIYRGSSGSYMSETRIMYGYIYDVLDDGYMVYLTDVNDRSVLKDVTHEDCIFVTTRYEAGYYMKLDKAGGKKAVIGASSKDLKGFKDVGEDCSRVVLQTYVGRNYGMYIFE